MEWTPYLRKFLVACLIGYRKLYTNIWILLGSACEFLAAIVKECWKLESAYSAVLWWKHFVNNDIAILLSNKDCIQSMKLEIRPISYLRSREYEEIARYE